jgi:hypothetical protein
MRCYRHDEAHTLVKLILHAFWIQTSGMSVPDPLIQGNNYGDTSQLFPTKSPVCKVEDIKRTIELA